MTMETHRYSENRFDYRFLKGFDVHTDSDFRQWWNPQKFDWTYRATNLKRDTFRRFGSIAISQSSEI